MSRGEWVTLPQGARTAHYRRASIAGYNPSSDGGVLFVLESGYEAWTSLPLAEFEALLFAPAPAEDDAYTRAAVRYAEASVALNDAEMKLTRAVDRKQHDTDDLRSDVCSAGYAHDDAEDAFTALYREKHGG